MSLDASPPPNVIEMVTGVSRSGRIRKKSSKLADFTEEIEPRPKKFSLPQRSPRTDIGYQSGDMKVFSPEPTGASESNTDEMPDSGTDDGEATRRDATTRRAPQRSIYMQEKSSKKQKLLKDGTIVLSKAQRKDKGKPRFTAYMLWSKVSTLFSFLLTSLGMLY